MTNPYRAMCAELLAWAEHTSSHYYKQPDVLDRARALLAQPVADGPTDEEIYEWKYSEFLPSLSQYQQLAYPVTDKDLRIITRAVLSRWGRPTPQPVAVSKRPWERKGWCDADGKCWLESVTIIPDHAVWIKTWPAWAEKFPQCYVRSLPANALPTPETTDG